jgi:heme/copper-type cytochrome/quinol oxidase subunit 2
MRHTIPKLTAALVAVACAVGLSSLPAGAAPSGAKPAVPASRSTEPTLRKYNVTASDGGIIPGHIRMRKGEKVRITFVSRDDKYSIRFKDFGVKETLTPETPVVIEIAPSRAGTYEFRCARVWGVKRLGHNGTLVVTD